jgi:hypothetical protein
VVFILKLKCVWWKYSCVIRGNRVVLIGILIPVMMRAGICHGRSCCSVTLFTLFGDCYSVLQYVTVFFDTVDAAASSRVWLWLACGVCVSQLMCQWRKWLSNQ